MFQPRVSHDIAIHPLQAHSKVRTLSKYTYNPGPLQTCDTLNPNPHRLVEKMSESHGVGAIHALNSLPVMRHLIQALPTVLIGLKRRRLPSLLESLPLVR